MTCPEVVIIIDKYCMREGKGSALALNAQQRAQTSAKTKAITGEYRGGSEAKDCCCCLPSLRSIGKQERASEWPLGASIYDVRTEGGGGSINAANLRTNSSPVARRCLPNRSSF